MSQLEDAVNRYNKLLETAPYSDLSWVRSLQDQMEQNNLSAGGRLLCPFLRPNFISRRQYDTLVKTGEALITAVERMQQIVLSSPPLLARMELLPAEKMLALMDPGYQLSEVSTAFDSHIHNGSLHVLHYNTDAPSGIAYAEGLADLFYDCPPMKEFRRRYSLTRMGGKRHLLSALLKAYKQFSRKKPNIAILEFRPAFHPAGQSAAPSEYELFRDFFREEGYSVEIVSPDQLEYRNGVLRSGAFEINLMYRRISVQEFLMRFDLSHPLVQAYRDRAVCVVNSFRAELAHKKALFGLLTDETLTARFPTAERKAIREHVPWTRVVAAGKTTWRDQTVDLLEFIQEHRETLVLKPNDDYSDQHSVVGAETDQAGWERAVRQAQRVTYVVQEAVEPAKSVFPMMSYGHLEFREMQVDVQPQAYLGRVLGCASWLSASSLSGPAGLAPTFILDQK